jgi:DNA-binding transcriptional ArsR family regulator
MEAEAVDTALLALAHPVRRRLVSLCARQERGAGELGGALGLRQPAASQHLRVLRDAGILSVRAEANRRLYRVDFARLEQLRGVLDDLWLDRLPHLKRVAEARARSAAPES